MNDYRRSSLSWGVCAAWLGAFVFAVALFGAGLTCAVPLVAFAALCALRLGRGQALLFVGALWLADEVIEFALLHLPLAPAALGWAALFGVAALAATAVAGEVARRAPKAAGTVGAFLAAFAAYEGVMWAVSRMVGGARDAFGVGILGQVFALNAVTFGALLVVGALSARSGALSTLSGKAPYAPRRRAA